MKLRVNCYQSKNFFKLIHTANGLNYVNEHNTLRQQQKINCCVYIKV